MDEEKKKLLRNHIPTIRHLCDLFLQCIDCPDDVDEDVEKNYLLELLDKMKDSWEEAKTIVES